jgi:hypothetical protein
VYVRAVDTSERDQSMVLALLLHQHLAMTPLPTWPARSKASTLPAAVERLIADGMAHRLGELVGASWAAVRVHRLGQARPSAG